MLAPVSVPKSQQFIWIFFFLWLLWSGFNWLIARYKNKRKGNEFGKRHSDQEKQVETETKSKEMSLAQFKESQLLVGRNSKSLSKISVWILVWQNCETARNKTISYTCKTRSTGSMYTILSDGALIKYCTILYCVINCSIVLQWLIRVSSIE